MQLPHVLLQVEVPAEPFAAGLAGERFLVVVRVHVEGQIVDLMERLVADVALVGLFAAMRQFVILVVPLLVEAFAADVADERLVVVVYAPVGVQGRAAVESFVTGRTFVRLLRRVDDLVPAQGARLAKTFSADLADEWPGACVNRHVSGQVVVRVEHLPALPAGERLLLVRRAQFVAPRILFPLFLHAALTLGRDRRQARPRGSFLDGGGRREVLRNRRRRRRRRLEDPHQRIRVIIQKRVVLQQVLMPQRWHVLLERRLQVRGIRQRRDAGRLLRDARRGRRSLGERRLLAVLLGQSLIRLHDLRDGEGQVPARRRRGDPLWREAGRCLGRHCAARRERLHGRPGNGNDQGSVYFIRQDSACTARRCVASVRARGMSLPSL